jgi:excisionase family DNA binding protein
LAAQGRKENNPPLVEQRARPDEHGVQHGRTFTDGSLLSTKFFQRGKTSGRELIIHNMDEDDLLTPDEAGELLGITGARVRQLVRRGTLPGFQKGRAWLLHRRDVEASAKIERPAGGLAVRYGL